MHCYYINSFLFSNCLSANSAVAEANKTEVLPIPTIIYQPVMAPSQPVQQPPVYPPAQPLPPPVILPIPTENASYRPPALPTLPAVMMAPPAPVQQAPPIYPFPPLSPPIQQVIVPAISLVPQQVAAPSPNLVAPPQPQQLANIQQAPPPPSRPLPTLIYQAAPPQPPQYDPSITVAPLDVNLARQYQEENRVDYSDYDESH